MDLNGVGWLAAIVVGGFAGWIAEQFMNSNMGLLMNIILGIIGAAVMNFIFQAAGISLGYGVFRFLIAGFLGACLLIALGRVLRRG